MINVLDGVSKRPQRVDKTDEYIATTGLENYWIFAIEKLISMEKNKTD